MNKVTIAIFSLVILAAAFLYYKKSYAAHAGIVIILNGPSGSGKSSIQKEFQYLMMPNLWIKTGIDTLFDAPMPTITPENMAFWQSPNPIRWVETTKDKNHNNVITLLLENREKRLLMQ